MVLMLSKGILVHPHLDKGLRIIVHSRKQNKTKQNKTKQMDVVSDWIGAIKQSLEGSSDHSHKS